MKYILGLLLSSMAEPDIIHLAGYHRQVVGCRRQMMKSHRQVAERHHQAEPDPQYRRPTW